MRDLILARLAEIKTREQGFPKATMRWKNFNKTSNGDKNDIHISELDFNSLDDTELLFFFERLIRRHYSQM